MTRKIIISINTSWNLVNFRSGLITALIDAGYEVVAVAPYDEYADRLPSLGCRYIHLAMDNRGTHPVRDIILFFRFLRLMWQEKPDVFLAYTIKPNIYGSMAAHCMRIPVVNNIAGLGAVFINKSWLTSVVMKMYRVALSRSRTVFFQNAEDQEIFVTQGLVRKDVAELLPGSGVDLTKFAASENVSGHNKNERFRFLLVARMIGDKGINEFVQAARYIKSKGHQNVEFCLLGFLDVLNPTAISREQMNAWVNEGVVLYLGETDDVRPFISTADCIVLPSYREGTSRVLLEAAAMAKPILATDVAGCREVVEDKVNGLLCRPRDAQDLAEKMTDFLSYSTDNLKEMGRNGRIKIENEFDEQIVVKKYLSIVQKLTFNYCYRD